MNPARAIQGMPSTSREPIVLAFQVHLEINRAGNPGASNGGLLAPLQAAWEGGGSQDKGGKCENPNKRLNF